MRSHLHRPGGRWQREPPITPATPSGNDDLVTTLTEALSILNNQSCKVATHCLAAQLFTALLDIRNDGSLNHSCIDATIASASSYLDTNGYSVDGVSRSTALSLASTLEFWNGNGC